MKIIRPASPLSTTRYFWGCLTVVGGILVFLLANCAGQKVSTRASSQAKQYSVHEIVVLPLRTLETPQVASPVSESLHVPEDVIGSDISLSNPRSPKIVDRQTVSVPSNAGEKVAQILARKLARYAGVLVHSPQEAIRQMSRVQDSQSDWTVEKIGQSVAQDMRVDAALVGLLRIYKEREGGKFGAHPAVVGYEVKLVAADGHTLWKGDYYESQRPLTEDVGGVLSRGFGFFTAEELAEYGAEELAKQFPFGRAGTGPKEP